MTPAQQTALESVAGRALTEDDIAAIDPLLPGRQDIQIAAVLSAGQPKIQRSLTVEEMYETLFFSGDYLPLKQAQLAGNALAVMCFSILLDAKQIGPGTVNLSAPATSALLQQLIGAALLTQAGFDALIARSMVEAPAIHYNSVSDALNVAEGRLML